MSFYENLAFIFVIFGLIFRPFEFFLRYRPFVTSAFRTEPFESLCMVHFDIFYSESGRVIKYTDTLEKVIQNTTSLNTKFSN